MQQFRILSQFSHAEALPCPLSWAHHPWQLAVRRWDHLSSRAPQRAPQSPDFSGRALQSRVLAFNCCIFSWETWGTMNFGIFGVIRDYVPTSNYTSTCSSMKNITSLPIEESMVAVAYPWSHDRFCCTILGRSGSMTYLESKDRMSCRGHGPQKVEHQRHSDSCRV